MSEGTYTRGLVGIAVLTYSHVWLDRHRLPANSLWLSCGSVELPPRVEPTLGGEFADNIETDLTARLSDLSFLPLFPYISAVPQYDSRMPPGCHLQCPQTPDNAATAEEQATK